DARAWACVVRHGPFDPRLRQDRHPLPGQDSELAQSERDRAHPIRHFPVGHEPPRPRDLVPEGRRVARVALDGVEEQTGERARAHGWNLTENVTESGTGVPTAGRALAVTTTLSGGEPPISRTFTQATPSVFVETVSTVSSACAVSLLTSVTPPGVVANVMAWTTGRPA